MQSNLGSNTGRASKFKEFQQSTFSITDVISRPALISLTFVFIAWLYVWVPVQKVWTRQLSLIKTVGETVFPLDESPRTVNTGAFNDVSSSCDGLSSDSESTKIHRLQVSVHKIHQSLIGEGAHRKLHTSLVLEVSGGTKEIHVRGCDIVLLEVLPAGVFADDFQLQRLQQQGAWTQAHIHGDVDLERPASKSFQSTVDIRTPMPELPADATVPLTVTLPLHARYPSVNRESYCVLNITTPSICLYCEKAGHYDEIKSTGKRFSEGEWFPVTWEDSALLTQAPLLWLVPAGDPEYFDIVENITTLTAMLGVIYLFIAARNKEKHRK